jgi:nitroimidazol reductase NimA-like FMN-containing flavoprotein (pyridoxamine 5'-phosphate oxidase superfamily)
MADDETDSYAVESRNRLRRKYERGHYDRETVHAILDAAMLCHVAYVIDGQPYCTPTAFWREGDRLLWHASSASRAIRAQSAGIPVCLTVALMDAIVLARCGFNHSINYRSVMAYGRARAIEGTEAKLAAMDHFIDRFFPGRAATLRPPSPQEIKATTLVEMEIETAAAKIRDLPVHDEEEDYAVPAWTALIPVRQVLGAAKECPRQLPGLAAPAWTALYPEDRRLDEAVAEAYRAHYR